MSTLAEIQDAVAKLPGDEKKALALWLDSQADPSLPTDEEQQLLISLDEAMRDLDTGKGVSIVEARNRVAAWAGK
jgi:hypothetical protein